MEARDLLGRDEACRTVSNPYRFANSDTHTDHHMRSGHIQGQHITLGRRGKAAFRHSTFWGCTIRLVSTRW
jgi:hypothetical protein